MQTIPYNTDEGIIDLVRKDEHNAYVPSWTFYERRQWPSRYNDDHYDELRAELYKLRADNAELIERLREARESHLHASARDVQTIQQQAVELAKWQALADNLARLVISALRCQSDTWTEASNDALASYEALKKGEQP